MNERASISPSMAIPIPTQTGPKCLKSTEDFEVDITELTNLSTEGSSMDADATEYSSSFGETASRSDNSSGTSDAEVESQFSSDNALASMFNNYDGVLPTRRKKLTTHWKSFIRPLMWRCKWAELRIKELETQAKKYSRELEIHEQAKIMEINLDASELCSKSFPFSGHCWKRRSMKRRKRKQVEKIKDLTSLKSHHRLFSYLENKKADLDNPSIVDEIVVIDPICKHDDLSLGDKWFSGDEKFLEQILTKIETVQSQVYKIRNNLDTVMLKNGMKFSSSENLCLISPFDAQTSSAYSPAISPGNEDIGSAGAIYTPPLDFEIDDHDLALAEVISSCGMVDEIPDIIESTAGLLSAAADVTIHQALIESAENILDDAFLQNDADHNLDELDRIIDESFEMNLQQQLDVDEQNGFFLPLAELIPEPIEAENMTEEKPTLTSCLTSELYIPKAKRKRGERKAGPCGWNPS